MTVRCHRFAPHIRSGARKRHECRRLTRSRTQDGDGRALPEFLRAAEKVARHRHVTADVVLEEYLERARVPERGFALLESRETRERLLITMSDAQRRTAARVTVLLERGEHVQAAKVAETYMTAIGMGLTFLSEQVRLEKTVLKGMLSG